MSGGTEDVAQVQRALRVLEVQQRAQKRYYERNRDRYRERSLAYWTAHKDELNARRRARTAARRAEKGKAAAAVPQPGHEPESSGTED